MANTITQIKRIAGLRYNDSGVQSELADHANFTAVEMPNGEVGVEVSYNGEDVTFSSVQIMGMLLTKAKQIVMFNNPGVTNIDAVISVPPFFTDAQRRAVKDASQIAGFHCLRLLNEGTAAALSYGIFKGAKKEFPEGTETKIMFLDMGHSQFTATIASFTNTSLKVLASASDQDLGGRTLDVAISKYFSEEFKAKTGLDAWRNKKARVKLMVAAEKAKVSISPHGVNHTPVSIECLMEERDFNGQLTAEKLDELLWPIISARVGSVIRTALAQAGVTNYKDFASVELVGGSMRPRIIKRASAMALGMPIDEANGHGLSQSMNLDEAVARGCALQCAVLSPVFRVKPFDIIDVAPYPVRVTWDPPTGAEANATTDATNAENDDEGDNNNNSPSSAATSDGMIIFKTGDPSPLTRRVTFKRGNTFSIIAENTWTAEQAQMIPPGAASALGKYIVGGFPALENGAVPKIRVDFRHDENGIFGVVRAELLKEIKEEENNATPTSPPATTDQPPAPEQAKKKRYKRFDLKVEGGSTVSMDAATMKACIEKEIKMDAQDAEIRATQDMRNSLEAYIYSTRSALEEALVTFTTQKEREQCMNALNDMETWLYGDGFEADKKTYQNNLRELENRCNKIFSRKWESENRYNAIQVLTDTIENYRGVMTNRTGRHAHLSELDRDTIRAACSEAESWLKGKTAEQGSLELYQDPVLKVSDITAVRDRLDKELRPIERRAPPAPAPAPTPAPVPTGPETTNASNAQGEDKMDTGTTGPGTTGSNGDKMDESQTGPGATN